jgi:rSAM/selenodomain-associated transferase 1
MSRVALMIMAKAPQPGAVKTRLCPPLDAHHAARLYECFLRDKIEAVRSIDGTQPAIAYTPSGAERLFRELAPDFKLFVQQGDDLGSRLANAFDRLFDEGYTGVVALDSDTPTLPAEIIGRAAGLLDAPGNDVVLGPTADGGYYLIGLRHPFRELFQGLRGARLRFCGRLF